MTATSPASRVFAKPDEIVRVAEVEVGPPLDAKGSMRRSGEPGKFHGFPPPPIPVTSVTISGSWAPAADPVATAMGAPVTVMNSRVFEPLGPASTAQVAFVAQTTSATVFVFPPVHTAGAVLVAGPQSLSVKRITGLPDRLIATLKSKVMESPPSSMLVKPADDD